MKPKDDEKQRAIAEATFALVEQSGLSGLTMADIARTAGIATSTLYVYYPSKDELVSQLYDHAKAETAKRILHGYDPSAPYRGRLRHIWESLLRNRLERYAEAVFQEQYHNSHWFTQSNRARSAKLVVQFNALIEEGQRHEIVKALPIPLLAACILGSIRETATLIRTKVLPPTAATRDAAFTLCWDALKA